MDQNARARAERERLSHAIDKALEAQALAEKKKALARRAYSINETGDILNISRSTTYAALKSGLLDSTTIGRKRLVTAESVDRLLARASAMDTAL